MTTAEMFSIIEKMYKDLQELMAMEKQEQLHELEEDKEEEGEEEVSYAPSKPYGTLGSGICININLGESDG